LNKHSFVYLGAFNDVDRTFLSEHAALGLETQQLQVCFNQILFFEIQFYLL
jgi:hypothetical protein